MRPGFCVKCLERPSIKALAERASKSEESYYLIRVPSAAQGHCQPGGAWAKVTTGVFIRANLFPKGLGYLGSFWVFH